MSNGRFSQPRAHRDEEREIEQAFRQVTGQEKAPQPTRRPAYKPYPEEDEAFPEEVVVGEDFPLRDSFEDDFDEEYDEEYDGDGEDFIDRALAFGRKLFTFLEENRKVALLSACAVALILVVSIIGILFAGSSPEPVPQDEPILGNVFIANIPVGGMTREEAIRAVTDATAGTYSARDMVVQLSGTELRLSPADTGAALDVEAAVNAAWDYGHTGTKAEQEKARQDSLTGSHTIGLLPYLKLDTAYIRNTLDEYAKNASQTLTQTTYGLEGGLPDLTKENLGSAKPEQTLVITMGTPGVHFDVDTVYDQVLDAYSLNVFEVSAEVKDTVSEPDPIDLQAIYDEFYIAPVDSRVDLQKYEIIPGTYGFGFDVIEAQKLISAAGYGETVRIPMKFIPPEVLEADAFFKDVLGSYSIPCGSNSSINTNVTLACEAIHGTVINPGEEFSFHSVVGRPTKDKGYKKVLGCSADEDRIMGGGNCQVASTLYCAALISDLEIVSRKAHELTEDYIHYGLDAHVRWDGADLRFRNNSGYPIKIEAHVTGDSIQIHILGTELRTHYVKLETAISNTLSYKTEYEDFDYDNEEGYEDGEVIREGVNGYLVKTYKVKYDAATGAAISREYQGETRYSAVNKLVARVEPEPTEPPTEETEPQETEPAQTEPAETEPAETEPAETEPAETEPEQTQASETGHAETEPPVEPTETTAQTQSAAAG